MSGLVPKITNRFHTFDTFSCFLHHFLHWNRLFTDDFGCFTWCYFATQCTTGGRKRWCGWGSHAAMRCARFDGAPSRRRGCLLHQVCFSLSSSLKLSNLLTDWLTHWLTHSLIDSLTDLLTESAINHSLTDYGVSKTNLMYPQGFQLKYRHMTSQYQISVRVEEKRRGHLHRHGRGV